MTEPDDQSRSDVSAAARQLLETWYRLAHSHVMTGASCSCGAHGIVLRLEDFEQDIGDYLRNEGEQHQRRDVVGLLEKRAMVEGRWSLVGFLETLADAAEPIDRNAAKFVLDRLPRTVQSFEDLHRRR